MDEQNEKTLIKDITVQQFRSILQEELGKFSSGVAEVLVAVWEASKQEASPCNKD